VSFLARSNAAYRLQLTASSGASSRGSIQASVKPVEINAGGARVTRDATNVQVFINPRPDVLAIIEGPRISSGGTNATPDNAIRVTFDISLPDDLYQAEFVLTMDARR
jgi:hypothetical protein